MTPGSIIHKTARAAALAVSLWAASSAHAGGTTCLFRATGTITIAFGSLDPSTGSNAVANASVGTVGADEVGDCNPTSANMQMAVGNGQNYSGGSRRLRSGTNYIPYSVSFSGWSGTGPFTRARPGNNTWVTLTMTATILGTDYQDAPAGTYTDSVVLTLTP